MRLLKSIILGTSVVLALSSCDKGRKDPALTVLTATSGQDDAVSRVAIDEETMASCTWSADDKISVFTSSGQFKEFTLQEGAGQKTARFAALLGEGETVSDYAVYPAGAHVYQGGALSVHLPDSYSFTEGVSNIPLLSFVDDSKKLHFRQIGGVIRFGIRNITVGGTFFFICHTHRVTGDFTVDLSAADPVISAEASSEGSTVTISFEKPSSDTNLYYFYIPVPTGSYPDFDIVLKDKAGTVVMEKNAKSAKNVVSRGTVLKMRTISQPDFSGGTES